MDGWMRDLSDGQAALYKCTSEGNTRSFSLSLLEPPIPWGCWLLRILLRLARLPWILDVHPMRGAISSLNTSSWPNQTFLLLNVPIHNTDPAHLTPVLGYPLLYLILFVFMLPHCVYMLYKDVSPTSTCHIIKLQKGSSSNSVYTLKPDLYLFPTPQTAVYARLPCVSDSLVCILPLCVRSTKFAKRQRIRPWDLEGTTPYKPKSNLSCTLVLKPSKL